jgi:N-acetyl-S-(2-succino)cysteine monooxygenase
MISKHRKHMKLGLFLRPAGHHVAAWRHPQAQPDASENFQHQVQLAQLAERGLFDMLFVADTVAVPSNDLATIRYSGYVAWIEPYTLITALSSVTSKIGLVSTVTTSFNEPYNIARKFASLNLVSQGRAGWNVVTSSHPAEARNFGHDEHIPSDERYARANEFVDVVLNLWNSWSPHAFKRDQESGIFVEPDEILFKAHQGKYFKVSGPLNVPPSPQGRPLVVVAGASENGRELAARTADVVFAAHTELETAREFYADIKRRVEQKGRNPNQVLIMPGLQVTVGHSEAEAEEKYQILQDLITPEAGIRLLSQYIGFNLVGYDPEGLLPNIPESTSGMSRNTLLINLARKEGLTIRQLYQRIAGGRGHFSVCGTPSKIADVMEEWFTLNGADGFNIMPPVLPASLNEFVELVVPELQRRGLFRRGYEGSTLRVNLGLQH